MVSHLFERLNPAAGGHGFGGGVQVPDVDLGVRGPRGQDVGLDGRHVQSPHGAGVGAAGVEERVPFSREDPRCVHHPDVSLLSAP